MLQPLFLEYRYKGKYNRGLVIINRQSNCVLVTNKSGIKVIYEYQDAIQAICIDGESRSLFTATTSGDIFMSGLPVKSKRKRENSEPLANQSSQDIFADLLETPCPEHVEVTPLTNEIISVHRHICKIDGVCDLLVISGILVAVTMETKPSHYWNILYKDITDLQSSTSPESFCKIPIGEHVIDSKTSFDAKIYCCVPESEKTDTSEIKPGIFYLNKVMYNHLFGIDANLLDTPIILIGLPSGLVLWLPVATHQITVPSLLCDLKQTIHGLKYVQLQASENQHVESLLIFGSMGKVVAMTTDVNKSSDLVTKEFSIPGNVVTICMAYDTLYHSTGIDLYKTEIQEMLLQQPKDKTPIKSLTLGYGAIVAMTTKTISQQPPVVTIAMCTKTGKTLHIDHPIEQKAQQCSKQNQGARIKDLLAGINNIGQQLTFQKEIDQVQNSELEQLHLASHLASYLNNHSGLTPSKQKQHLGIDCCINVTTENYGSHISYKLVATIENQTHITLSEKWVFLVTLHQISHKEHSKQRVALKSKSVQISLLPPKGFQRLDLGIDQQTLESLPLNVSCSLVYTCEPSHGLHSNNAQQGNIKHSDVLVIPIATQVLNITHFMRLNNAATTNPTKLQNNCRIYSDSELAQILNEVAACRPGTCPNLVTEDEALGYVGYHSTTIVVPTEQLKLDLRSEGVNCKNDTDVCKCLIRKLFPHLCEVIMTSQVRLLTHKGHHITLGVKVGSGEQVVLEIQSENLQAMCETSIAIKQHIQYFRGIQGLKMRMLNIPMVEELRPFIHQTECLRTDLLSAQEAVLLGDKSVTTADVTQLYHRLRQIHIPHT